MNQTPRSTLLIFSITIFFFGLVGSISYAQTTTATVNGTVKDEQGAVVPGATVTLIDMATNRAVTDTTSGEGAFVFTDVRSGEYVITAEAKGFKKTEVQGIKVNVGLPATVHLKLETGGVSELVTTTASESQALINTESAELGTTVLARQINDLPLNGRNPVELATLQPGVATISGTRNATINGMRGSYNNITWDGINVQETYLRGNSSSGLFAQAGPRVSGVGEFTIITQNAGAADGTGAAQVKLVTPRGSSQFHGSLFEYHRNDVFDANSFFNNRAGLEKEKLIRNEFGFTVGGPFALPRFGDGGPVFTQKNKLFFYSYYEETRNIEQAALTRTVLTSDARLGLFKYRRGGNGPLQTVNLLTLTGRGIDPKVQSLINLTPVPNDITAAGDRVNTGGFRFNSPGGNTDRLFGFRIDYERSAHNRFEAVYSKDTNLTPNDAITNNTGEPFPGLPGKGQSPRRQRGALAWSFTPAQNISNELRGGFYRQRSLFFTNVQFPEGYQLLFPNIGGPSNVRLTNPVQNSLESGRNGKVHELMDNATWVKGNHVLQFGGNFRKTEVEPFSFGGTLPAYTLGFGTGNPNPLSSTNAAQFPGGISTTDFNIASNLLAFLTGAITTATQTFNATSGESGYIKGAEQRRNLTFNATGFYVSDTWRVRPNLSLKLGLRYDYYSPVKETNDLALLPIGGLDALRDPNVVIDVAGRHGLYKPDRNNFAPSFGFSWDPFGEGKTAIQGGYSINFVIDSLIQAAENSASDGNDGLSSIQTLQNLSGTVSTGGLVPIGTPTFKVPRTLLDQATINQNPVLFTIDPNLRTPYVQQWNLGIEREVLANTVARIRYVGNHAVKQLRGIDINQVKIFENGFLQDFLRAQRNLELSTALHLTSPAIPASPVFNPAVPGSQQLTIIPLVGRRGLFTTATGSTLDSTIVGFINTGEVGELVQRYVNNRNTYLTPGVNGATLTPAFFLPANGRAGNVDYLGNGSYSNYNALQAELLFRLRNSVHFQTNYTWSKGFNDFEGSDSNFSALLDLSRGELEKRRSLNDIRHIFKFNGIYPLPFGSGKRFLNSAGGLVNSLFGGWEISGIFEARTGRPLSIVSARGTVNRAGRSGRNTVNTTLTLDQLRSLTGVFIHPTTGRPLFLDPKLIGPDGRGNPEFFQNPAAGTYGSLQLTPIDGPRYWNLDVGFIKRTRINERMNIEFRAELFNALNHTNFFISGETQDINSESFGQLGSTFDPRIIQFALKLNF